MLEPRTVLQNRYEIVRQLGQGGMGAVYEATDQRFGSIVALKETLVPGEALKRAFEREARLLNTLQHAGLPHVIDYFFEDDGQFLVMQYIPGDDLGQMLRRRVEPFPVDDVLAWLDQLLDLLDYLHGHEPPIVHRDIKPENLKLTRRGSIILLDFGLAKGLAEQAAAATTSSSIVGYTPNYAPLEQIRGTGTDARSDLYALAATAYHLLTKELPPDAVARAECFVNGRGDLLRPANERNPSVPLAVASVLHAALGLRRDDRPESAAAMRAMLRGGTATDRPAQTSGATLVAGRTTAPQGYDTSPTSAPTFPAVPATIQPTYPATAPVSQPPASAGSSLASKLVIAVACVAIVGVLGIGAVLVYVYGLGAPGVRPSPAPQPGPVATDPGRRPSVEVSPPGQSVAPTTSSAPAGPVEITASATSIRDPLGSAHYDAEMAIDGRPGTAWVEGADGAGVGEAITLLLSKPAKVTRLRVLPGYFKSPQAWSDNNRVEHATVTLSDGRELDVTFDDEMREQFVPIGGDPVVTITVTIESAYLGGDEIDTAISEIAVDMP